MEIDANIPGYVTYSQTLMLKVLADEPINREHAEIIVKAAEKYKKFWDPRNLELAREIYRRLNNG